MELSEDYGNYTYDYYVAYGDVDDVRSGHQGEAAHLVSLVVYLVSFVLGLIGNGTVIWVTTCKSKRTVTGVWLLNLAVADFVFVLFLPLYIDYMLSEFHWHFGTLVCKLNSFVMVMNMYASVLFITVLSVDRYVSLAHLNWCRRRRTVRRAWLVCACVWAASAALSCPALIFRDTMLVHDKVMCFNNFHAHDLRVAAVRHMVVVAVRTTVCFLLPFTAICVTGALLTMKAHKAKQSVRFSSFTKTVSAVILAFFLCWTPFHIFSLMELSTYSSFHLHNVLKNGFPLASSLAFFNSCINPVLYVLLGKKVRYILKRACVSITKRSLRELSQSISATDMESVPETFQENLQNLQENLQNLQENLQENFQGNLQENLRENLQGNLQENLQENLQNLQENLQGNLQNLQENLQENLQNLQENLQENLQNLQGNLQENLQEEPVASSTL